MDEGLVDPKNTSPFCKGYVSYLAMAGSDKANATTGKPAMARLCGDFADSRQEGVCNY
jgi:hypothetical protein